MPLAGSNLRLVAFYDFGQTQHLHPLAGEQAREGISSLGLGLRLADGQHYQLRLDFARVMDGDSTSRPGDLSTHLQFVYLY